MVIYICMEEVYMYIYIINIVNKYKKYINMYGKIYICDQGVFQHQQLIL